VHLVLGLGNPGRKYDRTRHNVGFLVADRLCARGRESCDKAQLGALIAKLRVRDRDVVVAKPQGFMNLSGQPAVSLRGYYKVEMPAIIAVHDDMDIPFGQIRVKVGGGHGGHNGLRDLNARFGDPGYVRVRFGVSRPPPGWDPADYVLSAWTKAEDAELDALIDHAADAVEAVIADGAAAAMNRFNQRPPGSAASAPKGS
jgi:PTH1 family peptidyl-tRNA hydrolase